jgi:metal-sulfur cluster biosynthetic enzyme
MTKELIIEELYEIIDPEIKINVYDLGMIYDIRINDKNVDIDITLTSAGCPLADKIEEDLKNSMKKLGYNAIINWVWIPAWDISRITPEGKEQLASIGFPMKVLTSSTWKKRTKEDFHE